MITLTNVKAKTGVEAGVTIIRANTITTIQRLLGEQTFVHTNDKYYVVKESPEEVLKKIKNDEVSLFYRTGI